MPASSSPIIVALDYPNAQEALDFITQITPESCRLKVGNELFTAEGPAFVWELVKEGFDVFLDLKFYDIPRTVANACLAAADLGVWMVNVHCLGGREMLSAASEALSHSLHKPLLTGVTLLTSFHEKTLAEVGLMPPLENHVTQLAQLAKDTGLDGVVCSAQEASLLRKQLGSHFQLVTPGIRLEEDKIIADDQTRIATPLQAIKAGANYIVIGRPITTAVDPLEKLMLITQQIQKNIS